jgi:hypothetical protein
MVWLGPIPALGGEYPNVCFRVGCPGSGQSALDPNLAILAGKVMSAKARDRKLWLKVIGSAPIKAIGLASNLATHPLDRYTVFEKQYNAESRL